MEKKHIKSIANYFIWLLICLIIGMIGMWIHLGCPTGSNEGNFLSSFGRSLKYYIIIVIGNIRGICAFFFFLLLDIKYIKIQNLTKFKRFLYRFLSILLITFLVAIVHHLLEYQLDWI